MTQHSQIYFVSLNVLSLLSAPPPYSSCFRYLLLCMARHAGSSTARDYCQCNWLFQAWFDTILLSDPHTSLLSSVMERRCGSHETFTSSQLQRNRLFHFASLLRVRMETHSIRIHRNRPMLASHICCRQKKENKHKIPQINCLYTTAYAFRSHRGFSKS